MAAAHPRIRLLMHLLFFLIEHATLFFPAPGRGGRRRFSSLALEQRAAVLEGWRTSRLFPRRLVFASLRAILTMGYFALPRRAAPARARALRDPHAGLRGRSLVSADRRLARQHPALGAPISRRRATARRSRSMRRCTPPTGRARGERGRRRAARLRRLRPRRPRGGGRRRGRLRPVRRRRRQGARRRRASAWCCSKRGRPSRRPTSSSTGRSRWRAPCARAGCARRSAR